MKKILSALLALLTVASLAACASDSGSTSDTTASQSDTTDTTVADTTALTEVDYSPDTEGVDLEGADFGLVYFSNLLNHSWTGIPTDMNPTEETGDILNDAVYYRNRNVEEMVNVKISEYPMDGGQSGMSTALQTSVMAGDDIYDLAFQSIVGIKGLAEQGLVRDINKLDVNTDAPWYDQKSVEELTVDDKLFFVTTDISYFDKLATIVTYFNKSIAEDFGMGDFYQTVDDGNWTFDYMVECAKKITNDVDGNGTFDKNDSYGIICQNDGSYYLLHSTGLKAGDNSKGDLRFAANDERFITALQEIFDLMASNDYFNTQKVQTPINETAQMFADDRALFLIRPIQTVFLLREMESDFGIIPTPKYFEDDDEYHTPTNIYPGIIMCVPKNTKNTDYISLMIDLLASESHDNVMPVLYDTVLDAKLTRDDISSRMLDIVFDSRVYDFGMIWDIGGLRTTIVTSNHLTVASTIASLTEKANTEIADLYDAFAAVEG